MRTWLAGVMLLAALSAGSTSAATAPPILGIVLDGGQGHLGRLDPDTLRPLRTSTFLTNGYAVAPALSPDGATVVLGSTSFIGVRFVDVATLRAVREVRLPLTGAHVVASAWPSAERLVVAAVRGGPPSVIAITVGVGRSEVVRTHTVAGTALDAARTPDGLAVLVAPGKTARARLVVLSPTRVRVWTLPIVESRRNGAALAVDASRGRAYVLDGAGRVADVDLSTGAATLHLLSRRTPAKAGDRVERTARWLGGGLIAVTGTDRADAFGLRLVDVRRWRMRMVDADASAMVVADRVLFALAPRSTTPLRAYDFTGRLRFELDDVASGSWVQVAGSRAYVAGRAFELPSGRAIGRTIASPRVVVLATDGSTFPL